METSRKRVFLAERTKTKVQRQEYSRNSKKDNVAKLSKRKSNRKREERGDGCKISQGHQNPPRT